MYVALKRMLFGGERLEPGDEVPVEDGRNYNLLLRQGAIADLDERSRSEEGHVAAVKGYNARIEKLETQLAEAQAEIAHLREHQDADPEASPGPGPETASRGGEDAETATDGVASDENEVPNRTDEHAGEPVDGNPSADDASPDAAAGPGATDRSKMKLSELKEHALGLGIDEAAAFKSKKQAIEAIEQAETQE